MLISGENSVAKFARAGNPRILPVTSYSGVARTSAIYKRSLIIDVKPVKLLHFANHSGNTYSYMHVPCNYRSYNRARCVFLARLSRNTVRQTTVISYYTVEARCFAAIVYHRDRNAPISRFGLTDSRQRPKFVSR